MYVLDETWDMWYTRKSKADYALSFRQNYRSDLKKLVSRDYNHPCVLMYSIANEVSEPASHEGVALAQEMVSLLHEMDHTRPVTGGFNLFILSRAASGKSVYKDDGSGRDQSNDEKTAGMNSLMFNILTSMIGSSMNKGANSKKADKITSPVLDSLDIAGYNYASGRYPLEGKAHPERIVVGSETFPPEIAKNWAMVKKYPYLIGDFMWAAWDYIGEVGAGAWTYKPEEKGFEKPYPWMLAQSGAIDILGNPGGEAYWAAAVWNKLSHPYLAVRPVSLSHIRPAKSAWRGTDSIPCWSWQGCEGKKAVVEVFYDCYRAELFLNGKKVGKTKMKDCRGIFKTKYQPGKLEVVCYDSENHEAGRDVLETAASAEITIHPEKKTVYPGEVLYIPVSIGDEKWFEGNKDQKLSVKCTNGELLAFGSARPSAEEKYTSGSFTTYFGRALAVVKSCREGTVTVEVSSADKSASCSISIEK